MTYSSSTGTSSKDSWWDLHHAAPSVITETPERAKSERYEAVPGGISAVIVGSFIATQEDEAKNGPEDFRNPDETVVHGQQLSPKSVKTFQSPPMHSCSSTPTSTKHSMPKTTGKNGYDELSGDRVDQANASNSSRTAGNVAPGPAKTDNTEEFVIGTPVDSPRPVPMVSMVVGTPVSYVPGSKRGPEEIDNPSESSSIKYDSTASTPRSSTMPTQGGKSSRARTARDSPRPHSLNPQDLGERLKRIPPFPKCPEPKSKISTPDSESAGSSRTTGAPIIPERKSKASPGAHKRKMQAPDHPDDPRRVENDKLRAKLSRCQEFIKSADTIHKQSMD